MIETRLSDLSSDPAEFTKVKEEYAEALSKSGFTEDLEFKKSSAQPRKTANAISSGSTHHLTKQLPTISEESSIR